MMFGSNYTKWIPLGEFYFGSSQSIVMVRGNKKTGELFFKTKRVNRNFCGYCNHIGRIPISVEEQWQKLNQLMNVK